MERFANFVVKRRRLVLLIAVLLLIPSIFGAIGTYINYDILSYLPKDLESMMGEEALEKDFKIASTAMITVENMATNDVLKLKDELSSVEGVDKVLGGSDILDPTVPKELLPKDLEKFFYNDSGATLMIVKFSDSSASKSTMDALSQIKGILKKDCFLGGMSAILQDTKALADHEMPIYVLIAVGLALLVLALGLQSTLSPFLFMLGIAFPILYNFGTNYFLGQISYITNALATVLQLGVTMDFSIFLLHRYDEEKAVRNDNEAAMAKAIQNTFSSITGSSLTTIAGFLAMCTMSLTLGRDIGIVMAKGVLLGVICTVTILPALILTFDKLIHRFTHPTLIPKFNRIADWTVRHNKAILVTFLVLFIPFTLAQSKTEVYYNLLDTLPKDLVSMQGTDQLKKDFNMTTSHFILVDESMSNNDIREMSEKIEKLDGVEQVLSFEKFVGGGIPETVIPDDIREIFNAGGRKMILANSSYKSASDAQNKQLDEINGIVKAYDKSALVTGEGAMTKDLISVANTDFQNVNITSIAVVFLIILLVFRSASIPVILVAAIEAAITINLAIPYFAGQTIPFISSIVIGTIQLGATVDYAILMTTRFREELNHGYTPKEAVSIAIKTCSQSILTSGLTFFAATVGVAMVSRIELIKNLCLLISRGAVISMLVILFVLPALLILFSNVIKHTTIRWIKPNKDPVRLTEQK